jgi:hypothetical protein
MQEIESVIDEPCTALAVGRRLRLGETRQSSLIDAAELTIEIGGLHVQVGQRCAGARIFVSPIEAGPGQELHASIVDAGGHAKAVELYFMQPLRPDGGFSTSWESCGGTKRGSGMPRRDGPDLTVSEAEP